MLFFIIFLIIPLIEISLFISIGQELGVTTTLLLTVFTAIVGSFILRKQGIITFFEAQKSFQDGSLPFRALFDGFCLVISGATLITPGFFTDFIGFCLLIPPLRTLLWDNLPRFFDIETYSGTEDPFSRPKDRPTIIDVEFERVDEDSDDRT
jgi:UPF0716 protein FxsA